MLLGASIGMEAHLQQGRVILRHGLRAVAAHHAAAIGGLLTADGVLAAQFPQQASHQRVHVRRHQALQADGHIGKGARGHGANARRLLPLEAGQQRLEMVLGEYRIIPVIGSAQLTDVSACHGDDIVPVDWPEAAGFTRQGRSQQ